MHFQEEEFITKGGSSLIDYNWFIGLGTIMFLIIGACLLAAYFKYNNKTAVQPPSTASSPEDESTNSFKSASI